MFDANDRHMMNRDPQNKLMYDSEEGILTFNFKEFFKLYFYHVLFFCLIGPIANLVIAPLEGWKFVRNLKFCDWNF